MFGNLFNQKKNDAQPEETTQVVGAQVKVSGSDDFFGTPTPQVTETINVVAPAAPAVPPPAPVATPVADPAQPAPTAPETPANPGSLTSDPAARENVTALSRLDPRATQVLRHAEELAKKSSQQEITPDDLL